MLIQIGVMQYYFASKIQIEGIHIHCFNDSDRSDTIHCFNDSYRSDAMYNIMITDSMIQVLLTVHSRPIYHQSGNYDAKTIT